MSNPAKRTASVILSSSISPVTVANPFERSTTTESTPWRPVCNPHSNLHNYTDLCLEVIGFD